MKNIFLSALLILLAYSVQAQTYLFDGYQSSFNTPHGGYQGYTHEVASSIEVDTSKGVITYSEGEYKSYYKIVEILPIANGEMFVCGDVIFTIKPKEVVMIVKSDRKLTIFKTFFKEI